MAWWWFCAGVIFGVAVLLVARLRTRVRRDEVAPYRDAIGEIYVVVGHRNDDGTIEIEKVAVFPRHATDEEVAASAKRMIEKHGEALKKLAEHDRT